MLAPARRLSGSMPASYGNLRRFFGQNSIRNLALTRELMLLLELLTNHGIEAVPFKGPSLAQSLYGNVALRRTIDLDILVRRKDILLAKQLLLAEGFQMAGEMSAAQQENHLDSHYHFEFHRPKGDVHVELHWELLPKHCGYFDTSYVWSHLTTARLAGRPVLALGAEELFVLLCVHHGTKHTWDRLKWIADIGRMIDAHHKINWSGVLLRARSLGRNGPSYWAVFSPNPCSAWLAADLLGRGQRPLPGAHAALVRGRLFRPGHRLPGFRVVRLSRPDSASVRRLDLNSAVSAVSSAVMTPEWGDRCVCGSRPFSFSTTCTVGSPLASMGPRFQASQ